MFEVGEWGDDFINMALSDRALYRMVQIGPPEDNNRTKGNLPLVGQETTTKVQKGPQPRILRGTAPRLRSGAEATDRRSQPRHLGRRDSIPQPYDPEAAASSVLEQRF